MPQGSEALTYDSYLRLKELLSLQSPRSQPRAHDEMQFIIVHQVYELWFKLLLHEIRGVIQRLESDDVGGAIWLLRRAVEIERVMVQQVSVLETMSPAKFLEFRDLLQPASGLQSAQFRELEFLSGLRDERYLLLFPEGDERRRLEEAARGPSVWSAFVRLLGRRGFRTESAEDLLGALTRIYADGTHADLHALCEVMVEYDEEFRIWRARHAFMAERMIGAKPGTGDVHTGRLVGRPSFQEPGVRYLQGRVGISFFPLLWEVRTRLGDKRNGA
jgi:tryptophan 2,3-dioxygenase